MLKDPCSMKEVLAGKIRRHLLPSFSCFATRYLCLLLLEALLGKSGNDYTSDGEAQEISNGRSV
jgi:hypothetical protein